MPEESPDPGQPNVKNIAALIREKMQTDEEFIEGEEMFARRERLGGVGGPWRKAKSDLSRDFDGKTAFRESKDKGTPYDI